MPRFTVFTATYNRAHTLHRVHDSLLAQTCRDFEWLIVDDGSTDGTAALVAGWAAQAPFPVRYVWQAHGGQHRACNRGLTRARGEFFAMIDSDDACSPDALAQMSALWESIEPIERHRFAGVGGLCCDEHGTLVGDRFPREPYDAGAFDIYFGDRLRGQKWWCVRTDVLRRHRWLDTPYKSPNPWFEISRRYRFRLCNQRLKVFYQDDPENSQSRARCSLRPAPVLHRHEDNLLRYIDRWTQHPAEFLRSALHYTRCSLHLGRGLGEQWARLTNGPTRLLWLATLSPAMALWCRDRLKLTIKR